MEKAYSRINWKNGSRSTDTPLNETNMNLMDSAIDVIDDRVCVHDAQIQTLQGYETRAAQSAAEALQSAQDSEGSATEASGYVSDCNTLANLCSQHYLNAKAEAQNSEAWAKGTRNGTAVPSTDETYHNNSKYYAEEAQQIVDDFTINNETPTFTQASTRTNINSGETISTIMGKIKKFFADLKTVAFTGSYNDLLNKPEHLGHSIKDETTTFTDRASLKFTGNVSVSDDSTNDETIIDVEGKPDHFYATKEDMLDDIDNIGEGEMAYTEEDASDLLTRVENIEQDVSDAQDDIEQINSNLSVVSDVTSITWGSSNYTNRRAWAYRIGNMLFYNLRFTSTFAYTNAEIAIATFGINPSVDQSGVSQSCDGVVYSGNNVYRSYTTQLSDNNFWIQFTGSVSANQEVTAIGFMFI